MKNRYQTSFVIDKKLWIKFKSKTLEEGVSIKDKLDFLITRYVKEKKESNNGSRWFHISKW